MYWKILAAIFTTLATTGATVAIHAAESTSVDGRQLYIDYGCYQCHGFEGQGARMSGSKIAPDPLPYVAFSEIVRRPYGVMPAYSPNVLDEETLNSIYKYLQSIK